MTKRGTNAFHGSVRSFLSHDDLQSSNLPDELVGDPRLAGNDKAEPHRPDQRLGRRLSRAVIKDKLWFWGSYGQNDIRLVRLNQTKDKTLLKNWNAKLNWQASAKDMVSFFWFNGAKEKYRARPRAGG